MNGCFLRAIGVYDMQIVFADVLQVLLCTAALDTTCTFKKLVRKGQCAAATTLCSVLVTCKYSLSHTHAAPTNMRIILLSICLSFRSSNCAATKALPLKHWLIKLQCSHHYEVCQHLLDCVVYGAAT
eukprot:8243-Heterococcus_DN1.PRE.1